MLPCYTDYSMLFDQFEYVIVQISMCQAMNIDYNDRTRHVYRQ
jgi:hypothetical protein